MNFIQRLFKGGRKGSRGKERRYPGRAFSEYAHRGLGFKEMPYRGQIESRFEEIFEKHKDYWNRVRIRVLADNPDISEVMYSWLLLEFKRFLVMNIYLKSVGMYNSKVDEIWHSALLFSRDYQEFCFDLFGQMIHHAPHIGNSSRSEEYDRALFDLVYSTIFDIHTESTILLGALGNRTLDPTFEEQVLLLDRKYILQHYFKQNTIILFSHSVEDVIQQIQLTLRRDARVKKTLLTESSKSGGNPKSRQARPGTWRGTARTIPSNRSGGANGGSGSDSVLSTLLILNMMNSGNSGNDGNDGNSGDGGGGSSRNDDSNGSSGAGTSCSSISSCSSGSSCSSASCSS